MATLDLSTARLKEPELFDKHVHVHTLDVESLRILIEDAQEGLLRDLDLGPNLMGALAHVMSGTVFVTTASGTTYEIDFHDATKDKIYYAGDIKVRAAQYIITQKEGDQDTVEGYIGLSAGPSPRLQFFKNLKNEMPTDPDLSIARYASGVLKKIELVIDWSK